MNEQLRAAEETAILFVFELLSEIMWHNPHPDVIYTAGPCPLCGRVSRGSRVCVECKIAKLGELTAQGQYQAERMLRWIQAMRNTQKRLLECLKHELANGEVTPAQLKEVWKL